MVASQTTIYVLIYFPYNLTKRVGKIYTDSAAEIPSTAFQFIDVQFKCNLETDQFHNFCEFSLTRTI